MIRIVHISDLHIGNFSTERTLDRLERIRGMFFLGENYSGDNYLLITGDVTNDGSFRNISRAFDALSLFPQSRLLLCPGNHDYGNFGLMYSKKRAQGFNTLVREQDKDKYFNKRLVVRRIHSVSKPKQSLLTVGVSSCCHTWWPFDLACGEVGEKQLQKLSDLISSEPSTTPILIYLHHHPFDRNLGEPLLDSIGLITLVSNRANITVAFGHKHVQSFIQAKGEPLFVAAGDLAHCKTIRCLTYNNGIHTYRVSLG